VVDNTSGTVHPLAHCITLLLEPRFRPLFFRPPLNEESQSRHIILIEVKAGLRPRRDAAGPWSRLTNSSAIDARSAGRRAP
jgi:hypothetical protein